MRIQALWHHLLLSACIVVSPPPLCADDRATTEVEKLLSRALEIEDIRASGSQPFLLRASLTVEISKRQFQGTYFLAWESKSRWREEIKVADFQRTLVGTNGGTWRVQSHDFTPQFALDLDALLDIRSPLSSETSKNKKGKHPKKTGDSNIACFKASGLARADLELCLDLQTNLLVHWEFPAPSVGYLPEKVEFDYSDFSPWGEKRFPFHLRSERRKSTIVDLSVTELGPLAANYDGFVPPENAVFWPSCEKRGSARQRLQHGDPPQYPVASRSRGEQGIVTLYAIIEGDGSPSHLKVIRSGGSAFDQSALEAVRQWRYEPLICDGKAMRVETTIDVIFALR